MNDGNATPPPPSKPATPPGPTFAELGVGPEVRKALADMGFERPMEVQARAFPVVRSGKDVMVQSRTGSGKTAGFGIPIVDRIVDPNQKAVQAIVLLPTRELALQVAAELARLSAHRGISVVPVYGGAPMGRQIEQLKAGGQVVAGTPGRVLDHMRRGTLKLDQVKVAVLDECDEMLSMGFQEDIEAILERTPAERQTLLFSATVPEGIQRLSKRFMRNPELLKLSQDFVGVHEIRHVYYTVSGGNREADLLRILEFENPGRAIVFCNTREETGRVAEFLKSKGHSAEAISSDLSQSDREKVMTQMRAGSIRFLVATDVAARGIDLEALSHVFNYTFPDSPEVYIHRTGRTGRAGRQGTAVSLIGPTEVGPFYYLKLLYKIKPEERSLPSEPEIRSRREGEKILALRKAFPGDPGGSWRSLARRLMGALDAERLVGALLAARFGEETTAAAGTVEAPSPTAAESPNVPERPVGGERPVRTEPRRDERDRGGRRGERSSRWGDRDRGPRDRGDERGTRGERFERDRTPRAETPPAAAAPTPPTPPASSESGEERRPAPSWRDETRASMMAPKTPPARAGHPDDFASVWSDADAPAPSAPTAAVDDGEVRLYVNLGRKDRIGEAEVADLLREAAGVTPTSLDVMNTHTYVNVRPEDAERVVTALAGREHAGRRLVCETARPRRR